MFSNYIKPTPVYPLYPESFLNVGLGLGSGYCGMGTKAVFGYKNSGLCAGLGLNGPFGGLRYTFGFQMSYKFLYPSFSYGTYSITLSNNTDYLIPNGLHNAIGVMIGLGKSKRNFLDVGVEISYGYTFIGNRSSYHSAGGTIGTYLHSNSSSHGKEPSNIT